MNNIINLPQGGVWLLWKVKNNVVTEFRILTNQEYKNNLIHWYQDSEVCWKFVDNKLPISLDYVVLETITKAGSIEPLALKMLNNDLCRLNIDNWRCDDALFSETESWFFRPCAHTVITERQQLDC